MTEIAVAGLADLRRTLLQLPAKIQRRALRTAIAAGARVVAAEARRLAPVRTGAIKRNIVAKRGARKYDFGADARSIIGVKHGRINTNAITRGGKKRKVTAYDKRGQDPYYFRFQELGFSAGNNRQIEGRHFLERALQSSARAATEKIRSTLAAQIQKAL